MYPLPERARPLFFVCQLTLLALQISLTWSQVGPNTDAPGTTLQDLDEIVWTELEPGVWSG